MYGKLQNKKSTSPLVAFEQLESLCQNNQVQAGMIQGGKEIREIASKKAEGKDSKLE